MTTPPQPPPTEWHTSFPTPHSLPSKITKEEVLTILTQSRTSPSSPQSNPILLIDLRRNDHYGLTIYGSLNLPAQSVYFGMETLYRLVKGAGIGRVIWYCRSSNGRGPRGAAWFQDYLEAKGETGIESLVLQGGIKGWIEGGEEYRAFLVGEGNVKDI